MTTINLLDPQDWTFPVPITYGPGRLSELPSLCLDAGTRRPLVVTDRGSKNLPYLADIQKYLTNAGLVPGVYAGISPNPRDDEIVAGKVQFKSGNHDGVIALGGGSGMDGGKAVCLTATNDIGIAEFNYDNPPPDMSGRTKFPPLICIPTTAGTGGETESTAMITDTRHLMKYCSWHPDLKPHTALLDPEITVGLPTNLTAWTGCDAMIHAIEGYCVPAFHPLCDGAALEGLKLIHQWLPIATGNPANLEARGGMLVGSCLAGISFLKGLGMVHAISHMVGAEFDTHHGLTNAVVLPVVLKFNQDAIADKVEPMANAMGLIDTTFDGFYAAVCERLDQLEIPRTLADIGVPLDCASNIAGKALQDSAATTNPRSASIEETEELINQAIRVGR